jgi:lysophospholipase L1-like esterase
MLPFVLVALGLPTMLLLSCCAWYAWRARRLPAAPVDVLIVGSSVAAGTGAGCCGRNPGWAALLCDTLEQQRGLSCFNGAVQGYTAGRTLPRLQSLLPVAKPQAVVVGLSLGNERLAARRDAVVAQTLADDFVAGLLRIATEARAAGASVVFTGMYPNGWYRSHHLSALRSVDDVLQQHGHRVVHMLSHLEHSSKNGTWKDELRADWAHPNAAGHRVMYEQFVPRLDELFGSLPGRSAIEDVYAGVAASNGAPVTSDEQPQGMRRRLAEPTCTSGRSAAELNASLIVKGAE